MLANLNTCTGCSACCQVCNVDAIRMHSDRHGFFYPVVDEEKCISCGSCERVCPAGVTIDEKEPLEVYAAKHKDEEVLLGSASGGAFTAISDYVLSRGGVVYGAVHTSELRTVHIRGETVQERNRMRGSKYVQSEIGTAFQEALRDLESGRLVLFTGTPCQIDGLRRIVPSSVNRENLILVDIVCAGVPSPLLFREYVAYCEKQTGKKLADHIHRPKEVGWGTHREINCFTDGSRDSSSMRSQIWKHLFHSGSFNRPSCYQCKYLTSARVSDLTIGDFWGYNKAGIQMAPDGGLSLILVNTQLGQSVLRRIENTLFLEKSTLQQALIGQPRLRGIPCENGETELMWRLVEEKGIRYILKRNDSINLLTVKRKVKQIIKRTLKRQNE